MANLPISVETTSVVELAHQVQLENTARLERCNVREMAARFHQNNQ